jgi:hypothetical protein
VATPRRAGRVPVRINPRTWEQEVDRYRKNAPPRVVAERERRGLERDGLDISGLKRCSGQGEDGTSLEGLVKVYVPIGGAPPSERAYGFVFIPTRQGALALVAFGERHPAPGTRSVYERAHKRLHGRYPDQ